MLWIKIGKISLSNKSNTYIACVYNSPKNSTYTKENECNVLQLIVKQLAKFSELDQIIIGGGFNSRIGTKADFIVEDRKDLDFLPEGYELDTFTTHRNNEDVSLNSYGEQLIQLCVASKLRVLNGRTREDLQGHFIYLGYRVVAQWTSENIFQINQVQQLSVQPFTTFSDHRLILLTILWKYPTRIDETNTSNCALEDKSQGFIWNSKLEKLYTEALEKEQGSIKRKDFNELQANKIENKNVEIENLLSNVEDTFINTARKVLIKTRKHKESEVKNRKIGNKKWFSKACNDKCKELKIISNSLNRNPNNHFLRTKFYQLRKVYKSLCKKLKLRYDQQLIKKLETDPNNFWNLLKQLKTGGKFVSNKEDLPPLDEMQEHYMKLLQKQTVCNSFNNEKIKLRNKLNVNQLNKPFDLEEIKQRIIKLNSKKSPGIDCISSEIIKCPVMPY